MTHVLKWVTTTVTLSVGMCCYLAAIICNRNCTDVLIAAVIVFILQFIVVVLRLFKYVNSTLKASIFFALSKPCLQHSSSWRWVIYTDELYIHRITRIKYDDKVLIPVFNWNWPQKPAAVYYIKRSTCLKKITWRN